MSEIEIQEKLVEIANRVPPSDRWDVKGVENIQPSLTDALEAYFMIAEIKPKSFRLDLADGKLYAIFPEQVEIKKPEVKKYSIYGDYIYE
jgi:hypothetical protein